MGRSVRNEPSLAPTPQDCGGYQEPCRRATPVAPVAAGIPAASAGGLMSRRAPAEGRARAGGDESPAGGSGPLPSNYEALISRMEYVGNRWAIKGPRCRPFTNQLSLVSTRVNSLQQAILMHSKSLAYSGTHFNSMLMAANLGLWESAVRATTIHPKSNPGLAPSPGTELHHVIRVSLGDIALSASSSHSLLPLLAKRSK